MEELKETSKAAKKLYTARGAAKDREDLSSLRLQIWK
jgi:hypothetical protein